MPHRLYWLWDTSTLEESHIGKTFFNYDFLPLPHPPFLASRDIKTNNMALNSRGYVELLDFGLAKEVFSKDRLHKSLCGTAEYMGNAHPFSYYTC